jgi:DNA-directed RNA polymerase subunit RPC12/RpoP
MQEKENEKPGIKCPKCNCMDFLDESGRPAEPVTVTKTDKGNIIISDQPWKVIKTENFSGFIRRLRKCRYCGHVVRTKEKIEIEDIHHEEKKNHEEKDI